MTKYLTMFIKRLDITADVEKLRTDISQLLTVASWEPFNQISLKYRPGAIDPWADGLGSLYDRDSDSHLGAESEFTEWNQHTPEYTRSIINQLSQTLDIEIGRVRFMLLKPKTGLTIHRDREVRYHIAIDTNPYSYISISKQTKTDDEELTSCGMNYHIPVNSHWYQVDTRYKHHVYNGGRINRIHLVVCGI